MLLLKAEIKQSFVLSQTCGHKIATYIRRNCGRNCKLYVQEYLCKYIINLLTEFKYHTHLINL